METEQDTTRKNGARPGCVIVGWAVFCVIAGVIGLFGYRVWYYYDRLSRGERIELPQFASRLSVANEVPVGDSLPMVERSIVESGGQISGAEDAALTVVEFGDFECSYSKEVYAIVRRLMTKYGDKVRFIYRNYPIESMHPDALLAAVAAECAASQDRFWAYHDKLYLNSPALTFPDLVRYGAEIGLDTPAFEQCMIARETEPAVLADIAAAKASGVRGTPTFFLNGYKIEGAVPEEDFDDVIDELLRKLQ